MRLVLLTRMGFDPVPLQMSFAYREQLYPQQVYNCRAPKWSSYHYQESGSSPIHSVKNSLQLVKATKQCVPRAFEAAINWLSCSMDNRGNMLHKTTCEIIIDGESMNNAGGVHNVLKQWPEIFQRLSARSHLIVVPTNGKKKT